MARVADDFAMVDEPVLRPGPNTCSKVQMAEPYVAYGTFKHDIAANDYTRLEILRVQDKITGTNKISHSRFAFSH